MEVGRDSVDLFALSSFAGGADAAGAVATKGPSLRIERY